MNLRKAFSVNYSVEKQEHGSGYNVSHNLHKAGDELHYAAETGELALMDTILTQDPQAVNRLHSSQGTTPICWSLSAKQDAATHKLLDHNPAMLMAEKPFKHYFPISFINPSAIRSDAENRLIVLLQESIKATFIQLHTMNLIETTKWLHVYIMTVDLSSYRNGFNAEHKYESYRWAYGVINQWKDNSPESETKATYLTCLLINLKSALERFHAQHPELTHLPDFITVVTEGIKGYITSAVFKDYTDDDFSFSLYSPHPELMLSEIDKHPPEYILKALDFSHADFYYCMALNLQNARHVNYQTNSESFVYIADALALLDDINMTNITNDELGRLLAYTAIDCQHLATTPGENDLIISLLIKSVKTQFYCKNDVTMWLAQLLLSVKESNPTVTYRLLEELFVSDFDISAERDEFHNSHVRIAKSVLVRMIIDNIASLSISLMLVPSEASLPINSIELEFNILILCVKLLKKCSPKINVNTFVEKHFSSLAMLLPQELLRSHALSFLPLKNVYEKTFDVSLDNEYLQMLTQEAANAIAAKNVPQLLATCEALESYYRSNGDSDSKELMKKFKKLFSSNAGLIDTRDGFADFFENYKASVNSGNNCLARIFYELAESIVIRLRNRDDDLAPFSFSTLGERTYFMTTHERIKFEYLTLYVNTSITMAGIFSPRHRHNQEEKKDETSELDSAINNIRLD